ncbi:MAG: sialidase family protein [Gammaproteobacteria bacterium]
MQEYRGAALYAAWSHDGGATFEKPMSIGQNTCECCRVAVDFAGSGNPVVVWRNLFGEIRITPSPLSPGPQRLVRFTGISENREIDACPHQGPTLAVADDGTYHVAWFTASDTRQGLFYARSTDAGATFSAPMPSAIQPVSQRASVVGAGRQDLACLAGVRMRQGDQSRCGWNRITVARTGRHRRWLAVLLELPIIHGAAMAVVRLCRLTPMMAIARCRWTEDLRK